MNEATVSKMLSPVYTIFGNNHGLVPFDHMLVAQAMVEGLVLVTRDAALAAYNVTVLRCEGQIPGSASTKAQKDLFFLSLRMVSSFLGSGGFRLA